MKTEQQNIAIAESVSQKPDVYIYGGQGYPDYTGDLNAIHDVLSSITRSQLYMVNCELLEILRRDTDNPYGNYTMLATAGQLAEAYCRALRLWVESNE